MSAAYRIAWLRAWWRCVYRAARRMWHPCLQDRVWYDGRVWLLTQGVLDPHWTLRRRGDVAYVHKSKFVNLSYLRSFRTTYRFWMDYWHLIWVSDLLRQSAERQAGAGR